MKQFSLLLLLLFLLTNSGLGQGASTSVRPHLRLCPERISASKLGMYSNEYCSNTGTKSHIFNMGKQIERPLFSFSARMQDRKGLVVTTELQKGLLKT